MNYEIAVVDRVTAFVGDNRAVQHCVRGDTIEVSFDTEWNNVGDIAALFVNRADGTRKTVVMDSTHIVTIPWETMRTQGELYVTFFGYVGDIDAEGIRIQTKLMEAPFIVEKSEAVDLVVPEATEDVLHTILTAVAEIAAATQAALVAAARAEAAAEAIGTSTVTRTEFDEAINELAGILANYVGRIWYLNRVLYVPAEMTEIDGDVLRVAGEYDSETQTLWIGEING